jgi:hypothetical protein
MMRGDDTDDAVVGAALIAEAAIAVISLVRGLSK